MPPRTTPANTALTRHGLERRRHQFKDLHQFMVQEELAFNTLLGQLQSFVERYIELLGDHYLELDALESQLHTATRYLAEALCRHGIEAPMPLAPQATALPVLPQLPPSAPLPPEPLEASLAEVQLGPPSLKTLYRRAAMRLHPDFAADDAERQSREQAMMAVNTAYAQGERAPLEAMLLAAGESPQRVMGGNADALLAWLSRSEHLVQGRLRVVQAYRVALQAHPMHQLWVAITRAEQKGLDPLCVMASRLRSQIQERRRELYIGQRLQAESGLAQAFLHRRVQRMGAAPRVSPATFEAPRQPA